MTTDPIRESCIKISRIVKSKLCNEARKIFNNYKNAIIKVDGKFAIAISGSCGSEIPTTKSDIDYLLLYEVKEDLHAVAKSKVFEPLSTELHDSLKKLIKRGEIPIEKLCQVQAGESALVYVPTVLTYLFAQMEVIDPTWSELDKKRKRITSASMIILTESRFAFGEKNFYKDVKMRLVQEFERRAINIKLTFFMIAYNYYTIFTHKVPWELLTKGRLGVKGKREWLKAWYRVVMFLTRTFALEFLGLRGTSDLVSIWQILAALKASQIDRNSYVNLNDVVHNVLDAKFAELKEEHLQVLSEKLSTLFLALMNRIGIPTQTEMNFIISQYDDEWSIDVH